MSTYINTIFFFREEYSLLYAILFFLVFFISFNKNRHINNTITIFVATVYGLVIGLRDVYIGADTINYYNIFINNKVILGDEFFSIFTKFTHLFLTSPTEYVVLLSLMFYILLGVFCIKKSDFIGNSLLLFFGFISVVYMYEVTTNVIRQGISVVIALLSLLYFNKSKLKFLLLVILSILFHFSSILFATATLITNRIKIKTAIFIYVISIVLYILNISLISITNIIFNYIPIFQGIDPRIDFLASGEALNYYKITRSGMTGYIIINTFFMVCYYLIRKKELRLFENDFLIKLYIILSSLLVLSSDFPFPDRIGVFSWFLIPLIFEPMLRKNIKIKIIYVIFMAAFFFSWAFIRSYYQI